MLWGLSSISLHKENNKNQSIPKCMRLADVFFYSFLGTNYKTDRMKCIFSLPPPYFLCGTGNIPACTDVDKAHVSWDPFQWNA